MCKFRYLVLILIILCLGTGCSNNSYNVTIDTEHKKDTVYEDSGKAVGSYTPHTLMDLFDGKQKVWILTESDEVSYDSGVELVLVTENKCVTEAYYFVSANEIKNIIPKIDVLRTNRFELCDFEGMSDAQIIDEVRKSYIDASVTYSIEIFNQFALSFAEEMWEGNSLPLNITYRGELDNSGNNIKDATENVLFLTHYKNDKFEFEFHETLMPTIIKDKQYVGIIGYDHHDERCLITLNNFKSYDTISNDSYN